MIFHVGNDISKLAFDKKLWLSITNESTIGKNKRQTRIMKIWCTEFCWGLILV